MFDVLNFGMSEKDQLKDLVDLREHLLLPGSVGLLQGSGLRIDGNGSVIKHSRRIHFCLAQL